jgi:deazaflavin-dependent oxidoreductase (nitroreductase family)
MEILRTNLVKNALESDALVGLLKRTVPPLDRALLRGSRGWVNTAMQSVLLLETIGAKSGQRREIATLCMPVGIDMVLVGSNWGQQRHPAWVHNLRTNPEAKVAFRGYVGPVESRELGGRERTEMWQRLIRYNPQYERYQSMTRRTLPVMLLHRPD